MLIDKYRNHQKYIRTSKIVDYELKNANATLQAGDLAKWLTIKKNGSYSDFPFIFDLLLSYVEYPAIARKATISMNKSIIDELSHILGHLDSIKERLEMEEEFKDLYLLRRDTRARIESLQNEIKLLESINKNAQ